jgi:hypothetical protein
MGRPTPAHSCARCAEPQVERPRYGLCVWCEEELTRRALRTATGEAKPTDKVEAIDFLRARYSVEQVQMARAAIRAGADAEDVARGLEESRDGAAVAA